jgi:hypothetical protein
LAQLRQHGHDGIVSAVEQFHAGECHDTAGMPAGIIDVGNRSARLDVRQKNIQRGNDRLGRLHAEQIARTQHQARQCQ